MGLQPIASLLVTLMVSTCTTFSCRALELAFARLVGKTKGALVLIIVVLALLHLNHLFPLPCPLAGFSVRATFEDLLSPGGGGS